MNTVKKLTSENRTIGFDFSPEGSFIAGATVATVVSVTAVPSTGAPTFSTPVRNDVEFLDSDGTHIPVHKGVVTRLSGGTVGSYTFTCLVDTSDGDRLSVQCRVIVY